MSVSAAAPSSGLASASPTSLPGVENKATVSADIKAIENGEPQSTTAATPELSAPPHRDLATPDAPPGQYSFAMAQDGEDWKPGEEWLPERGAEDDRGIHPSIRNTEEVSRQKLRDEGLDVPPREEWTERTKGVLGRVFGRPPKSNGTPPKSNFSVIPAEALAIGNAIVDTVQANPGKTAAVGGAALIAAAGVSLLTGPGAVAAPVLLLGGLASLGVGALFSSSGGQVNGSETV